VKMNCPTCFNELSKKWQPPQSTKALAPRGQWSCGVCGGIFTRLEIQAAGKPVIAVPVVSPLIPVDALAAPQKPEPVVGDEDEVSEARLPSWA
jgi:hypothetical protein